MYHIFMGRSCLTSMEPCESFQAAVDKIGRMAAQGRMCGFHPRTFTVTRDGEPLRSFTR